MMNNWKKRDYCNHLLNESDFNMMRYTSFFNVNLFLIF